MDITQAEERNGLGMDVDARQWRRLRDVLVLRSEAPGGHVERAAFKRSEIRRVYDLIADLREGLSDGPDDAARPASEAGGE